MENIQNREVHRDGRVDFWLSVSGVGMGVGVGVGVPSRNLLLRRDWGEVWGPAWVPSPVCTPWCP